MCSPIRCSQLWHDGFFLYVSDWMSIDWTIPIPWWIEWLELKALTKSQHSTSVFGELKWNVAEDGTFESAERDAAAVFNQTFTIAAGFASLGTRWYISFWWIDITIEIDQNWWICTAGAATRGRTNPLQIWKTNPKSHKSITDRMMMMMLMGASDCLIFMSNWSRFHCDWLAVLADSGASECSIKLN